MEIRKMKGMWKILTGMCLLALLAACSSGNGKAEKNGRAAEAVAADRRPTEKAFPLPQVPMVMTDAAEREAFLLTHYWDAYAVPDTLRAADRQVVEQAFVAFATLLERRASEPETVRAAMGSFCGALEQAGARVRTDLTRLMDECLYNPNSRFYDEALYAVYLEERLAAADKADPLRSAWVFKLDLIRRNAVGSAASDFVYSLPDGRRRTLYATPVQGRWLLLVFYDPECHSCHDILAGMFADEVLRQAVGQKQVSVLAVYTEGKENVWKKYLPGMPSSWVIGNDAGRVKEQALYDLKAMPTLYLLDSDRKVVLKDAAYEKIKAFLVQRKAVGKTP